MNKTPEEIRNMEHMHIKMSYNQITDLIYAGNNMCCQDHFEEELLSKEISADISFEAERLDNPQGVKYFFWLPWVEDTAPTVELIDLALNIVDGTGFIGPKHKNVCPLQEWTRKNHYFFSFVFYTQE